MKFGNAICIFLNSENLIYLSTDISNVSGGPFKFEITKVDCILMMKTIFLANRGSKFINTAKSLDVGNLNIIATALRWNSFVHNTAKCSKDGMANCVDPAD